MIEHYSNKIQNAIQKELFKAKSSIKIAVAWFTNDLLFQPLLLKLSTGVNVELILNKDDINCSEDNDIDFNEFVNAGGVLRWNDTKQLLHDKFCIIDDSVVIYGSYNWTNKAEYNEESIAIARQESETIDFYSEKFEKLSNKYCAEIYTGKSHYDDSYEIKEDFNESPAEIPTINTISQSFIDTVYNKGKFPSQMFITDKVRLFPTIYKEFPKLNFYDNIERGPWWGNNDLPYHIAKNNNQLFLLDNQTMSPINDFCFSDYKYVGDYESRYFPKLQTIWLKIGEKWGLFDVEKKKFCIPPICDDFRIHKQFFEQYEIVVNSKHGIADVYGNIVLDWVFDEIVIRDKDLFRVQYNEKYAIIINGHLQVVYEECEYRGITQSKGKYGLISWAGSIILDFVYDKIEYLEPFGCGYYVFYKGGKCGIRVAKNGKTTPCIYKNHDDLPIWGYSGEELVLKEGTPLL